MSAGQQASLLDQLAALFAEVDAAYDGSSCPASTECCRFAVTGREPYVTSIELAAIGSALARQGGELSTRRRALPLAGTREDERTCPLLDRDGRCAVYASRPLGCRTFFCSRATRAEPPRAAQRDFARRVQELAARHEVGGDAPRPLSRAIAPRARGQIAKKRGVQ